jgi:hypothetical protein
MGLWRYCHCSLAATTAMVVHIEFAIGSCESKVSGNNKITFHLFIHPSTFPSERIYPHIPFAFIKFRVFPLIWLCSVRIQPLETQLCALRQMVLQIQSSMSLLVHRRANLGHHDPPCQSIPLPHPKQQEALNQLPSSRPTCGFSNLTSSMSNGLSIEPIYYTLALLRSSSSNLPEMTFLQALL